MDLFSWGILAAAIPAVLFAGVSKAGFGSGVDFASAAILAMVLDPRLAIGLMLPLMMLVDVASLTAFWRKWDWAAARVLLTGAVPGALLGALFFASADPDAIRLMIGVVSLLFVAWRLAQNTGLIRPGRRFGPRAGVVAGVVSGFTSFVSHAGGPAAAVYLFGLGLGKTAFQATTLLTFWLVNMLKCGLYAQMGIFTPEALLLALALAPVAMLGAWLGIRAHYRVSERLFFGIAYVALTLTGTKLVWDALT